MARIRSIKPEMPQDAALASVSRGARYTFVLLLTQCDDAGFFRANMRILLGQLYPHDLTISENQLAAELDELAPFIELRDGADGPVGHVRNWKKHQKIDRPTKSFLEPLFAKASPRVRVVVASDARECREDDARGQRIGVLSPESLSPESRVLSPDLKSPRAKKPRERSVPFKLAPYIDAHLEFFPGSVVPADRYGRAFKRLEAKYGAEETLKRWRHCLAKKHTFATPEELGTHWSEYAANGANPELTRLAAVIEDANAREAESEAFLATRGVR